MLEKKLRYKEVYDRTVCGTSLVIQCLRVHLPTQGTWVQSLVGDLNIPHALELSAIITMLAATREAPHPTRKTQHSQKKKKKVTATGKEGKGKIGRKGKSPLREQTELGMLDGFMQ